MITEKKLRAVMKRIENVTSVNLASLTSELLIADVVTNDIPDLKKDLSVGYAALENIWSTLYATKIFAMKLLRYLKEQNYG